MERYDYSKYISNTLDNVKILQARFEAKLYVKPMLLVGDDGKNLIKHQGKYTNGQIIVSRSWAFSVGLWIGAFTSIVSGVHAMLTHGPHFPDRVSTFSFSPVFPFESPPYRGL